MSAFRVASKTEEIYKAMSNESQLDEQMLSRAAKVTISNQLDEAEQLEVEVETNLLKIVQGKADSISVEGKGLVVQGGIHVQEVGLQTDAIAVNPLNAILGKIKLDHPVNSNVRLVMTEADINHTMNSDFVRSHLSPLELTVDGKTVLVNLQLPIEVRLPDVGRIVFNGNMSIEEPEQTRQISFHAIIAPRTDEQPLRLERFQCVEGQGISLDFTIALMQKLKELVNLPFLEVEGTALRIKKLVVEKGSLTLHAETHTSQIPSSF